MLFLKYLFNLIQLYNYNLLGTTITGILASLATQDFKISLQIALCHTFFNITGIFLKIV